VVSRRNLLGKYLPEYIHSFSLNEKSHSGAETEIFIKAKEFIFQWRRCLQVVIYYTIFCLVLELALVSFRSSSGTAANGLA
jgi:hypothetical protein